MKIKLLLLIIVFFKGINSNSQTSEELLGKENDTVIIWTKKRKLDWSDFKSKKPIENFGSTQSMLGIKMEPYLSDKGTYHYKFFAYFKKNQSIANFKTDYLLTHEQIHFDIVEIFARKMRREVYTLKLKNKTLQFEDYRLVYKNFIKQKNNYQDKYDLETNHSRIFKMQKKWGEKVTQELDMLKDYSLKIDNCKTKNSSN